MNKLKVSEIKEIIENHNLPLPPLQQGEKKLKSYYVRTLEGAIQPDGTFLVHNKPISIPAEEKVLKACLESWFYTRKKTGSEETGFRRSLFAGHVSESKTLAGIPAFLYKHVAGVEVHDTKTYGLLMKERGIWNVLYENGSCGFFFIT